MMKLLSLGLLSTLLVLTLACAKGSDFTAQDHAKHSVTSEGKSFPPDIRDSFKGLPGGQLTASSTDTFTTPTDSSIFSAELLTYTSPVVATVEALEFMDSEMTIEMYVSYMNTPTPETPTIGGTGTDTTTTDTTNTNNDGSLDTGSGTGTTTGEATTGQQESAKTELFRPIMQDERYCGIYMIDSKGGRLVFPINTFAGFTVTTAASSKANVDPFVKVQGSQKARFQGGTDGETDPSSVVSFTVAPTRQSYPMVFVSQTEALLMAKWLGLNYRLPTVSEWLFASKGGTNFDFPTGTTINESLANYKGNFALANSTFPVKSYAPNPYGLYDMAGNVYEVTMYVEEDLGMAVPNNGFRYAMGGSYQTTNIALLSTWFVGLPLVDANVWAADLGFRLVYDPTRIPTIGESVELK